MYYLVHMKDQKEKIMFLNKEAKKVIINSNSFKSISYGYKTEKELIEAKKILKEPCVKCGGLVSARFCGDTGTEIIKLNMCFECLFWHSKLKYLNDESLVVIDKKMYFIEPDNILSNRSRGHGGREFIIKNLRTGKVTHTTNLWYSGEIPDEWREKFKDNSIFV